MRSVLHKLEDRNSWIRWEHALNFKRGQRNFESKNYLSWQSLQLKLQAWTQIHKFSKKTRCKGIQKQLGWTISRADGAQIFVLIQLLTIYRFHWISSHWLMAYWRHNIHWICNFMREGVVMTPEEARLEIQSFRSWKPVVLNLVLSCQRQQNLVLDLLHLPLHLSFHDPARVFIQQAQRYCAVKHAKSFHVEKLLESHPKRLKPKMKVTWIIALRIPVELYAKKAYLDFCSLSAESDCYQKSLDCKFETIMRSLKFDEHNKLRTVESSSC